MGCCCGRKVACFCFVLFKAWCREMFGRDGIVGWFWNRVMDNFATLLFY